MSRLNSLSRTCIFNEAFNSRQITKRIPLCLPLQLIIIADLHAIVASTVLREAQ